MDEYKQEENTSLKDAGEFMFKDFAFRTEAHLGGGGHCVMIPHFNTVFE